jgi:hypothetical protein
MSIDPLTIHVDRSIDGEQCVDQSTKKVDRSTSTGNKFMHKISENLIFNTKSSQIFFLAVRYDHFGAILAVRFSINRAQSFPLITHLISLPKLSISLQISLKFCLSLALSRVSPTKGKKKLGGSFL